MLPTYFISHGGGPWPYVDGPMRKGHAALELALRRVPSELGSVPNAVLVVSAHWEEPEFTVTGSARPSMLYDYGGFPESTYRVRYDAPGAPELAFRVQGLLREAGLVANVDDTRGLDHGTFVPLSVIYPDANIPVIQLSLKRDLDPGSHLEVGRALSVLRAEGVLIIGSGSSYHNLSMLGMAAKVPSKAFDDWLSETLMSSTSSARADRLRRWSEAPSARVAHPREEHLLPLMVVVGASHGDRVTRTYHEDAFLGSASVSSFRFDAA